MGLNFTAEELRDFPLRVMFLMGFSLIGISQRRNLVLKFDIQQYYKHIIVCGSLSSITINV